MTTLDTPQKDILKCELCGQSFDADNEDEVEDYNSIDNEGRCVGCLSELGHGWADRAY